MRLLTSEQISLQVLINNLPIVNNDDFRNSQLPVKEDFDENCFFKIPIRDYAEIIYTVRSDLLGINFFPSGVFYVLGRNENGGTFVMQEIMNQFDNSRIAMGIFDFKKEFIIPHISETFNISGNSIFSPYIIDFKDIRDYRSLNLEA